MKILITGISGFLGSHLARHLLHLGHTVSGVIRTTPPRSPLPDGIALHTIGDDPARLHDALAVERPDLVVHLAAHYVAEHRAEDIASLMRSNVEFGAHVLDAMARCGCTAMVAAGSAWQHGAAPVNLYAATKNAFFALADYYCSVIGLRLIELAVYDSYGPDDPRPKLMNLLKHYAATADILDMTPGAQRLHLVHIDDTVHGFDLACRQVMELNGGEKRCYRLPSPEVISLRDVVAAFNAADPRHPVNVAWGAREYRHREVFAPWEDAPPLPGWHARITLADGLAHLRAADRKEG